MNEEYIPTFEVVETKDEYGLLKRLDDFEDQIKLAKEINDKYENMKKDIKKKMVEIGKEKNATQIKWITPKGTQITCSIGQPPIFEKVTEKKFDVDILERDYPEIYEKCCKEVTYEDCVKARTNDVLRITLSKED